MREVTCGVCVVRLFTSASSSCCFNCIACNKLSKLKNSHKTSQADSLPVLNSSKLCDARHVAESLCVVFEVITRSFHPLAALLQL